MNEPILYKVPAQWLAIAIFLLILLFNWLGSWYRKIQVKKNPQEITDGLGPLESYLLGLMALLLAFTFEFATSKFEARRATITEEANTISTAILRCDMYPDSMRQLFRQDFVQYVETRIDYYEAGFDDKKIKAALEKGKYYSDRMWKRASIYSHGIGNWVSSSQMIPALNNMRAIVKTREAGRLAKVPPVILLTLLLLTLVSSFLVGNAHKGSRNPIVIACFALMTTIAIYLIMELDRPRNGIINLINAEKQIVELRELLKS